jgi:Asp-tRNA(Asn)/Glu-tRNA(Gln) amidotransferase A subunit family amidase
MVRQDGLPLIVFAAERTSPLGPLPPSVSAAFHQAVDAFGELFKMRVLWKEPEGFFADGDPDLDWFTVCAAEHVSALGREWVIEHMGQFHVATQEFLGSGLDVSIDEYLAARRRRYLYIRTMDELLGQNGLLLTPSVASEGWLADGRLSPGAGVHGLPPHVYSTAMQNITANPALSIPMGTLPTGLPFGLQITAPHFRDYRLLDIASDIESAYPWARTAPGYEPLDSVLDS